MSADVPAALAELRLALHEQAEPEFARGMRHYFNEEITPLGVRSAALRALLTRQWKRLNAWSKDDVFALCEALWASGVMEEGVLACKLADRLGQRIDAADFDRLERWMAEEVGNWAHCDDLATHALGRLVLREPGLRPRLAGWSRAGRVWVRRASAVALIPLLKAGEGLNQALATSDALMADTEPMVHKGVGWMLKVAAERHEDAIFDHVMARRADMPRIALRTAMEKMPQTRRKEALRRPK